MLVLTRRYGQGFVIHFPDGRTVRVQVNGFKATTGVVKLGIDAPADVKILRDELIEAEQVKRERESLTTDLGGEHG